MSFALISNFDDVGTNFEITVFFSCRLISRRCFSKREIRFMKYQSFLVIWNTEYKRMISFYAKIKLLEAARFAKQCFSSAIPQFQNANFSPKAATKKANATEQTGTFKTVRFFDALHFINIQHDNENHADFLRFHEPWQGYLFDYTTNYY